MCTRINSHSSEGANPIWRVSKGTAHSGKSEGICFVTEYASYVSGISMVQTPSVEPILIWPQTSV